MGNHETRRRGVTGLGVRGPDLETGRLLFARECGFVAGAATEAMLPAPVLPEIAFAGRSNVGKSSLLNALTGRNTLARVSHTPGRTQQLNFFDLGRRLMLVDMPGYGYAKVSKSQVAAWTGLIVSYLKGRTALCRVCVLVDSRHGLKDSDREVLKLLDQAAVSYQVVLTKVDELKPPQIEAVREKTAQELAKHPASFPELIATSARTGSGIPELRAVLAEMADRHAIQQGAAP